MNEEGRAYFAGFLDGEGCFALTKGRTRILITASNADPTVINQLQQAYGGRVYSTKRANPRHRRMWTWTITGLGARRVCEELAPRLRMKAEQALLLLAVQHTVQPHTNAKVLAPGVREFRDWAFHYMKGLHHVEA